MFVVSLAKFCFLGGGRTLKNLWAARCYIVGRAMLYCVVCQVVCFWRGAHIEISGPRDVNYIVPLQLCFVVVGRAMLYCASPVVLLCFAPMFFFLEGVFFWRVFYCASPASFFLLELR